MLLLIQKDLCLIERREELSDEFNYVFVEKEADRVISFVEHLQHYEGEFAGKPIILEPWQCFIIANLYGWRFKNDLTARRFLKAFIYVARKNGKTLLMSALALFDILTEKGAQAYSGATRRDQAAIAFNNVKQFVEHNNELSKLLTVYQSSIVYPPTASKFQALSSEAKKFDGLNPSLSIIDECAAQNSSMLVDVLQSGSYARKSPLLLEITTGSFNLESVGKREYDGSVSILRDEINDDRYFCMLYELDEGDSWRDETMYIKANPNLNVSVSLEKLLFARDEAVRMPYKEAEFRTKNLNQWMTSNVAWINDTAWIKCIKAEDDLRDDVFNEDILEESVACGAVDLSKRHDITAYTLYFWLEKYKRFYAKHHFYIPEEQIDAKMRNESMRFREWIKNGYVTVCPGEVIDYGYLYNDIRSDLDKYKILEIAYDDYNALDLEKQIGDLVTLINFPQNLKKLSPASKDWEASVLRGDIYDPNPVLRWMLSCACAYIDPNNNIKIRKDGDSTSSKRIDGVITSIMAHDRLSVNINNSASTVSSTELLNFFKLSI